MEVMVTPLEQFFEDGLVNVSRSLVGRTRLVYPKVPAPSQLLDGLLARRVAMSTVGSKVREVPWSGTLCCVLGLCCSVCVVTCSYVVEL